MGLLKRTTNGPSASERALSPGGALGWEPAAQRLRRQPQKAFGRGFTYLGVLVAIALISIGLMAVSEVWVRTAQREKMIQLEWAGTQYQRAIASYYHASPSGVKTYPAKLEDLLEDHRFATPRRHLRSLYPNPFTGRVDWDLIVEGRGVRGVASRVDVTGAPQVRQFVVENDAAWAASVGLP